MRKLFIVFAFLGSLQLSAQETAAPARIVPQITPAQHFQAQLEQLYLSFDAGEADRVNTLQNELIDMVRMDLAKGVQAVAGSIEARRSAHFQTVVEQFEGFSFYNATKEAAQPKLALLEECLAWMLAK